MAPQDRPALPLGHTVRSQGHTKVSRGLSMFGGSWVGPGSRGLDTGLWPRAGGPPLLSSGPACGKCRVQGGAKQNLRLKVPCSWRLLGAHMPPGEVSEQLSSVESTPTLRQNTPKWGDSRVWVQISLLTQQMVEHRRPRWGSQAWARRDPWGQNPSTHAWGGRCTAGNRPGRHRGARRVHHTAAAHTQSRSHHTSARRHLGHSAPENTRSRVFT